MSKGYISLEQIKCKHHKLSQEVELNPLVSCYYCNTAMTCYLFLVPMNFISIMYLAVTQEIIGTQVLGIIT